MMRIAWLLFYTIIQVHSATIPRSDNVSAATSVANICNSEICFKESDKMHGSMDESVDPCDDFYKFACGKLIRETVLPEDKDQQTPQTQAQDIVNEKMRLILIAEPHQNDPNPFKLAKTFTKICMNETTRIEKGKIKLILKNYVVFRKLWICFQVSRRWWTFWRNMADGL